MPMQKGEKNFKARLSEEDVRWIYENPRGLTQYQLAVIYAITQPAVCHIRTGRTWRHVTEKIDEERNVSSIRGDS